MFIVHFKGVDSIYRAFQGNTVICETQPTNYVEVPSKSIIFCFGT